ncbi:MAG: SAM-dependent methyltransferase [Patescibacteria group bacterium]
MELLNIGILLIVILLLILLSWIWPPDSPWAPWWRTSKEVARIAFKMANLSNKDIVYELGSGEATALMVAAKEFGAKGVGIEIDPIRAFISSMVLRSNGLSNKITIKRNNFFDEDISEATVVFIYLVPKTLNRLIPKFKKELKKGTPIISYKYEMNLPLRKFDKENELRLYVI